MKGILNMAVLLAMLTGTLNESFGQQKDREYLFRIYVDNQEGRQY
ncbi:hypothetical protein [Paraflavitalea pollutisoli]|nr:hypothetical protein [Paraflavitalea sp. H1-2-19X]